MDAPGKTHVQFDRPPVIETVLGIQFQPLQKWQTPIFGLFWATIRERYPQYKVVAPIERQIEDVDQPRREVGVPAISSYPLPLTPRCWFFNESETQLIQVQPDQFILNWKKGLVDASYPHYRNIRPVLEAEWEHFRAFVHNSDLGSIEVRQCEVTYINHIELGNDWSDFSELQSVLAVWSGGGLGRTSLQPEAINIGIRYRLPDRMGRLHVLAEPAVRTSDFKEVLQLTIIARGAPQSPDPTRVFEWLDASQEFVRESFVDLTTPKMHEAWGIRNQQ